MIIHFMITYLLPYLPRMSLKQQLLWTNRIDALSMSETQLESRIETTIANTFMRMWVVMLISFGVAYAMSLWMIPIWFSSTGYRVSWIAWMGIIFWMNSQRQTLSYTALAWLLMLFWVLEWYWLTWVFLGYSINSIYQVFLSSSVLFFVLAFAWYHTKIDVARVWPVLFWSMIALIISMLLNAFLFQSWQFDILLSVVWIVIFSWFIIYDMNVLKEQALVDNRKIELLMALWLFINFINIFLFMMRLFGNQD